MLLFFQGFSIQNLTPMEAAGVLYHCEQRMGKVIPDEDLTAGKLGQYLKPEDYNPIKQVSRFSSTSLLVLMVVELVPGSARPPLSSPHPLGPPLPLVLLVHSLYPIICKIFKNTSVPVKGQTTTDQFMQISFILVPHVLPGGFYAHFPARRTTSLLGQLSVIRQSYDSPSYRFYNRFLCYLQISEVREENIGMILKALEQPNVEMDELIKQQKVRYESKYS